MKIVVELSEEEADRLRTAAERLGVRPEDLARAGVADLSPPGVMRYLTLDEVLEIHGR